MIFPARGDLRPYRTSPNQPRFEGMNFNISRYFQLTGNFRLWNTAPGDG
jgi:hypothetical protein